MFYNALGRVERLEMALEFFNEMYPGFSKQVLKLLLESEVKKLLPQTIVESRDFEIVFSGEPNCFGTEGEQLLKYTLLQCRAKPFDGVLLQCQNVLLDKDVSTHIRKAAAAYIQFWFREYEKAFSAAKFAILDSRILDFERKWDCLACQSGTDEIAAEIAHALDAFSEMTETALTEAQVEEDFHIIIL